MISQLPLKEQQTSATTLKRCATDHFEPASKKSKTSSDSREPETDALVVADHAILPADQSETQNVDIEEECKDALQTPLQSHGESAALQMEEIASQAQPQTEGNPLTTVTYQQRQHPTIEEILESPIKLEDFDLSRPNKSQLFQQTKDQQQPWSEQLTADALTQLQQLNNHSVNADDLLSEANGLQFLTKLVDEALAAGLTNTAQVDSPTDTLATTPATSITTTSSTSASTPLLPHTPKKAPPDLPSTPELSSQQAQSKQPVPSTAEGVSLSAEELLKKEAMHQKIRADNRERKKRWRQLNEERNKDNDLRCRVNKRAHKLFGKEDSEEKRKWVEEEFLKRQQKRKEKERIKVVVDDSLGVQHQLHNNLTAATAMNGLDFSMLLHQLSAPQPNAQAIPDVNLLALLLSNLPAAAAIRSLLDAVTISQTTTNNSSTVATPTVSKSNSSIIDGQEQEQVLAQPAAKETAEQPLTNNNSDPASSSSDTLSILQQENAESSSAATLPQLFPMQLLELLHHLQANQQPLTASTTELTPSFQQNIASSNTSTSATTSTTPETQNHHENDLFSNNGAEDKLAALIATTMQATAAAVSQQQQQQQQQQQSTPVLEAEDTGQTDSNGTNRNDTLTSQQERIQQQQRLQQPVISGEFPLDAVLTLMQLNAGWRQ